MKSLKLTLGCLLTAAACSGDSAGPPLPAPDPGRMRVQISGAVHLTSEWQAYGVFRDLLASDSNEVSLMNGQNLDLTTSDSSFTLVFPGRLGVGQFAMGRYVPGLAPSAPAAFVILDGPVPGQSDAVFYASIPGGTISIDSAGYPARPGLTPGVLRGTLSFRAVSLVTTGDTITVHAEFAPRWNHYLFPNVSVTLSGAGPVVGTSRFSTAQSSDDDHGGRYVSWESDFGPVHTFPHDISQELRVFAPSVGTFTLTRTTPTQFANPASWPAIYTALFYRDDPRLGLSTGGTLTVTEFVAPTDEFYGEIHGTLTSALALWTDSTTLSGDTANVNVTFAVQLWPLGGIPASVRTNDRRVGR
jgi:hypothetical protein